jgi:hypothetical protein
MKDAINPKQNQDESKDGKTITIDFGTLYKFNPEDMNIDITDTFYTNHAYIQVMSRDAFIDFLQIPGIKKDGVMHVNGIRIYLTHAHAKKLAKSILSVVDNAHKEGKLESYDED